MRGPAGAAANYQRESSTFAIKHKIKALSPAEKKKPINEEEIEEDRGQGSEVGDSLIVDFENPYLSRSCSDGQLKSKMLGYEKLEMNYPLSGTKRAQI